jgi:hypothetical protein
MPSIKNENHNYITVIVVFFLPLLMYFYLLFPESKKLDLLIVKIDSGFFAAIDIYVFMIFIKIYTIAFLTIWFLTAKKWWKYFLLILILHLFYQLYYVLIKQQENNLIHSLQGLSFGIVLLIILLLIDKKFSRYSNETEQVITFDIINLIISSNQIKNISSQKQAVLNRLKVVDLNSAQKTSLLNKLKELELNLGKQKNEIYFFHRIKKTNLNSDLWMPIIILLALLLSISFRFITPDMKEFDLFFFKISSPLIDLKTYSWLIIQKLFNLILLLLWYFNCRNIMKYAILANIFIALLQLNTVFFW